jgi:hypothetical protein
MESFKIVGLIAFFLSLVSIVLPWMEVSMMFGLSTTIYGFTTDGVISFILLIACLGLVLTRPGKWKIYASIFLAFVALMITAATISRVSEIVEKEVAGTAGMSVSWGPGAPLMIISCLIMMAAGIMMHRVIKSPPQSK